MFHSISGSLAVTAIHVRESLCKKRLMLDATRYKTTQKVEKRRKYQAEMTDTDDKNTKFIPS